MDEVNFGQSAYVSRVIDDLEGYIRFLKTDIEELQTRLVVLRTERASLMALAQGIDNILCPKKTEGAPLQAGEDTSKARGVKK